MVQDGLSCWRPMQVGLKYIYININQYNGTVSWEKYGCVASENVYAISSTLEQENSIFSTWHERRGFHAYCSFAL